MGIRHTQPDPTALTLLFFVALLPLADKDFTTRQHEAHQARELVRRGGVRSLLVHSTASVPIEGAESLCDKLIDAIFRAWRT